MGKASMIEMKETRQTINFTNFNMKNQKHNIESDEVQINPNKTPVKINSKKKEVAKATMYEYMWCDTTKI